MKQYEVLPITCEILDHDGQPSLTAAPYATLSRVASTTSSRCQEQAAIHSGLDTLVVRYGALRTSVPIAVALAPKPSSLLGEFVQFDSLPGGIDAPWAPTALQGPHGEIELYYGAYGLKRDSLGLTRGDLVRTVSRDGLYFRYAGVAIPHDSISICSQQGQGVENMTIVPRPNAPAWRMFYAAGSSLCWGWQVFSAVSSDRVHWIKEPGVRLSNGATTPQSSENPYPPWPVGEGMEVYQDTSGMWRMIVAGHDHIQPVEAEWQIVEWTSPDQLHWTYVGTLLTSRDMPTLAKWDLYSPTIREFAAGLWRMLFTAVTRAPPETYSAIWSAVSVDRRHWQVEGQVLGYEGSDLFYTSGVGDSVYFIRRDHRRVPYGVSVASVEMP